MKAILNWRYYVIAVLFAVGLLAVARSFGEPTEPMTGGQWFTQTLVSLAIGAVSFFALYVCITYWERKGEIDEFSNLKNE